MKFSRVDEKGQPCPGTLGEYRDLCAVLSPHSRAVQFLDERIAEQGRDEEVIAPDSQVRAWLMPMLIVPAEPEPASSPPTAPVRSRLDRVYKGGQGEQAEPDLSDMGEGFELVATYENSIPGGPPLDIFKVKS